MTLGQWSCRCCYLIGGLIFAVGAAVALGAGVLFLIKLIGGLT